MPAALAERVAETVLALPKPAQVALQLRGRDGHDHAAIAAALRTTPEAVAEVLLEARLAIYAGLRGAPPPFPAGAACEPARRGLVRLLDGEEADGVRAHVADCVSCQAIRRALREADVAYQAWDGSPPPRISSGPPRRATPAVPRNGPTTAGRRLVGPTLVARRPAAPPAPKVRYPAPLPPKAQIPRHVIMRRRIGALIALLLTVGAIVAAVSLINGTDDPAPARIDNGTDIIPGPGERFCPAEDPLCR